jgi:hypothetical protein
MLTIQMGSLESSGEIRSPCLLRLFVNDSLWMVPLEMEPLPCAPLSIRRCVATVCSTASADIRNGAVRV